MSTESMLAAHEAVTEEAAKGEPGKVSKDSFRHLVSYKSSDTLPGVRHVGALGLDMTTDPSKGLQNEPSPEPTATTTASSNSSGTGFPR